MKKAKLKWLVEQSNAGEVIDKSHWGSGSELLYTCAKDPLISDFPDFPAKKRTRPGDLLLTRNGTPYIHKPEPGSIYTNVVQRISAPSIDRDFLHYALQSRVASFRGYGVSIESLNYEMWGNLDIWTTGRGHQAAIARFLDRETDRIDGLIAKKARFIALLKEKRAAVITHAVTKGIDPNAPMKEGPFKAVGMVPESWDISPIGRALRIRKNTVGSRHGDYRLLSLTTRGVIERDISENFGKFPESFDTYQEVRPGDFVFCLFDIDETPRTVGLSDLHGMITGAYSVFDCLAPVYSKYLYFLFLHLDMCKGLKPFYTGLRKTIRPPKFTSIRIPFPPEDEACRIVDHIETQTAKIDSLIALTERSIDLLREKRSALITAAVTGKIDVRRAA